MPVTDNDGMPGLRVETAASVVARDMFRQHLATFQFAIRTDRLSSRNTVAAYVDGLAGAVTLSIQGRHGSKDDIVETTIRQFRDAVERDLKHLKEI